MEPGTEPTISQEEERRAKARERSRIWREQIPLEERRRRSREHNRCYRANRHEAHLASQGRYREKNRDTLKARSKERYRAIKDTPYFQDDAALRSYKNNSRKLGRSWMLSDEFALQLCHSACHYCGHISTPRNGIDRKDSKRGYELDNVLPCCWPCNHAKRDMPYEQFLRQIGKTI
jgi:hypothetical protein